MGQLKSFRDWSIRHKLSGLLIAMACLTAIAVSVPMGIFDLWGLKRAMARDLETLANVLAQNSTGALTFHDARAARDVLQALRAEPSITTACIYTQDGRPFAKYKRDGDDAEFVPPRPEEQGIRFEGKRLLQFRKIVFRDEILGTIYIESDLQRLDARRREYTAAAIATLLVSLLLATWAASLLQRPISRPLLGLVETAKAISSAPDYSIRAKLLNRDEFGLLVSAFNKMLDQIEERDQQLRLHRSQLEEQVASRTSELSLANARLKLQAAALETAANSIVITDLNGTIAWTNPAFSKLTGYSAQETLGKNPRLLQSGQTSRALYERMWSTITSGNVWHGELVNRRKDGSLYTEEMTITPVSLEGSGITHFIAIKQDVTERCQAEEALQHAEEKYRAIFEDAVIGIFQTTADGRPLSINRALARMHGYDSPEQLLAEVSNVHTQLFVDPSQIQDLQRMLESDGVVRGAEVQVYDKNGAKKWVLVNLRAVRDTMGKIVIHEGTVEDITVRKVAEERAEFLAYYDALTGLPNRTLLQDRIAQALAAARRGNNRVALLCLDLDRFKNINDSLGHSTGDLLLREVAQRLKRWAREEDTVARVSGDEFLIALTGLKDAADAGIAAERILNGVMAEFVVDGHSLRTSCSVGISVFPEHGVDKESLIKHAETAMFCAKEAGRNTFRFFSSDMNVEVVERLTLENSLRVALERQQLFLLYQPQMELTTGRAIGVEALLRWQHPALGLVPPDKFIGVAENTGLIIPIGEWVLRTACDEARKWREHGLQPLPVAVNVSALQFRQEGFSKLVREILEEAQLAPEYLELELTESLLMSNADVTLRVLKELKAMGLKLAVDDFGTGYCSLSYLKQFPVSKLKIDRSFIRDVAINPDDAAIAAAIISMGKSLSLKVIAEGVENEDQMSFLRSHQCDEIQGYYFSRPLTAENLLEHLRTSELRALATHGS